MSERWYWCLTHARVEPEEGCPNDQRLGPYESREVAETALERARQRTQEMDEADRRDDDWGSGWGGGSP